MPNAVYFSASFGGIDLLIASISTEGGRDVAVHSPSRGSNHSLQDRGAKHQVSTVDLLFVDQAKKTQDYKSRFLAFKDLVDQGEASVFTHPILGAYRARISGLSHHASSEDKSIAATCTILPEEEPQQVFPVGAGVSSSAGLEAITAAADAADAKLAAVGLTSTIPTDAIAAAKTWSQRLDAASSAITAKVADLTSRINTVVGWASTANERLDMVTDLSKWEAYRALILLGYQIMRGGQAATADSSTFIDVTVGDDRPLRAICAEIFGPALAEARAQQAISINQIRTPGLIRKGTVLKMPSEGASP